MGSGSRRFTESIIVKKYIEDKIISSHATSKVGSMLTDTREIFKSLIQSGSPK